MGIASLSMLAMAGTATAATVQGDGAGRVTYIGDPVAETVTVTQTSATTVVFDVAGTTLTAGPQCVQNDADTATCTEAALAQVAVFLDAGNDTARIVTTASTTVAGGDGDDRIDFTGSTRSGSGFGEAGNDTLVSGAAEVGLDGGDGNDTLIGGDNSQTFNGGDGQDTLDGGAGDDQLNGGATAAGTTDGSDTITGGDGNDTVSYQGRTSGVYVDLGSDGNDGQTGVGENDQVSTMENIDGSDADDTLIGNAEDNTIQGFGGSDRIIGRRGFDVLFGEAIVVEGGAPGSDRIDAAGDIEGDLVNCGRGLGREGESDSDVANLDYLDHVAGTADCETTNRAAAPTRAPQFGTSGDDELRGDERANFLLGLRGSDRLFGLEGADELQGGVGGDRLFGGDGNDELYGGFGSDRVQGGAGNDLVSGSLGRDTLRGGSGRDVLFGGSGRDNLAGGPGRDFLVARDSARGDIVSCSRTRLRADRDVVVADRGDVVRNAAFCARVSRI